MPSYLIKDLQLLRFFSSNGMSTVTVLTVLLNCSEKQLNFISAVKLKVCLIG